MAPRRARTTRADAERSFEQLYRGHRGDVYRAALRELGNVHDAEDVTQAAFVDAYRAVLRGTRPQAPRAWLLAIAENVRRRRFRTSLRRVRELPLEDEATLAAEEPAGEVAALLGALGGLTAEQRRAFLLREIAGLSYEEIADRTGSTVGSVQMLLFRARRALRDELEPPRARHGALVPLATLFSRFEGVAPGLRAAGAAGAAVVALGVGAGAPAQADADRTPHQRADPPRAGTPAARPAAQRPAAPATAARPAPSAPAPQAPAPAPAPAAAPAAAPASPPPATAAVQQQQTPSPAKPAGTLPVAVPPLPDPSVPTVAPPPLDAATTLPALDPLLGAAGAAGAPGGSAPPLPELPLDPLPPVPGER